MERSPNLAEAVARIAPARQSGPGVVLGVVLVATLVAAVFGSGPLVSWAEDRPELEWAVPALERWDEAMQTVGAARAHPAIRAWMREIGGEG